MEMLTAAKLQKSEVVVAVLRIGHVAGPGVVSLAIFSKLTN